MTEKLSVGVIGLGYVGLPLLLHISKTCDSVIGFDVDKDRVDMLLAGKTQILGVDEELLCEVLDSGRVKLSNNPKILAEANIVLVCVPTPINENREIDLSYLNAAVQYLDENVKDGALVINESTSYPGTLRELFAEKLSRDNRQVFLATAPERIDPGNIILLEDIPRVVGGIDERSTQLAVAFYSRFFRTVVSVSSPEIAEMSKLLENTFRQLNISFINEFNDLCRRAGIDTREVINAAATKPYGFMKFNPSAGIGGHCIPVDPQYLQFFAKKYGEPLESVLVATSINENMGSRIYERIWSRPESKFFRNGLILGVSYKSNVPDLRDSPAVSIRETLESKNIKVKWHDPIIDMWKDEKSQLVSSGNWDFGIIVTAHKTLDIEEVKRYCKVVFDCTGEYLFDSDIVQI